MISKFISHLGFWLLFTVLLALSEWKHNYSLADAFTSEILFLPSRLLIVYLNWLFFIPMLLYRKRTFSYSLFIILSILLLAMIQRVFQLYWAYPVFFPELIDNDHIHFFKPTRILQNAIALIFPLAITTGWKLLIDFKKKKEREVVLEKEKNETELKYLKSQVNPHFLFNTLNTIYSMSLEGSKKVPNLILRLSDFLSFSLYETNNQFIYLGKEIELIKNFIEIQKDRFQERVLVKFKIEGIYESTSIPPMILIPFVENAFKHSLKNELNVAEINIDLNVSGELLKFQIKNSKPNNNMQGAEYKSGIGLQNIKRRLELIYETDYLLEVEDGENDYKVILKINL